MNTTSWHEQDGIIYFSITCNDTITGAEWIKRLEEQQYKITEKAKYLLASPGFKSVHGFTYDVAILKGVLLSKHSPKNIREFASDYQIPEAIIACLIREKFTDAEILTMGLSRIIVPHQPINDANNNPRLLGTFFDGWRGYLDVYDDDLNRWDRDNGYAFIVSCRPN